MKRYMTAAKRVVVKIGSALLIDGERGILRRAWPNALCDDVAALRGRAQEVESVAEGPIAVWRRGNMP